MREKGEAHQIEVKKQAEELKGAISRKESAIVYADKQIQDNLKTVENTKNGIEIQQGKIKEAELKISLTKENVEVPTDNTYVNSYIDENNDLTALTHDNQTIVLAKGTKVTLE